MNLNIKFFCLLTIILLFPNDNMAFDFEKDGLYYNIISATDRTVYVTYDDINGTYYSGDIVIPKTIQYNGIDFTIVDVDYQAFPFCKNIRSITIPKDLPSFGQTNKTIIGVRRYNEHPWDLYVPDFATLLNMNADYSAFPDQAREGGSIFVNGELLVNAIIPEGITKIRANAFFRYYKLKSINFSSTVKEIEKEAFMYCNNLESVELNDNLSDIGENAFYGCESLININLPKNLKTFGKEGGYVFYGCKNLNSLVFPEGIDEIPSGAFMECLKLNDIELPSTVSIIRKNSFNNCLSLNKIKCKAIAPPQCEADFSNVDKFNCKIIVPDESVSAYKGADGWKLFFNIIGENDEAAGIYSISMGTPNDHIYDMQGNRLDNVRKGVNIIRTKEGKTKKVMVK